jgi:hypothetical protein
VVLEDLRNLKAKDRPYLVKDRKAWYELVQKTKTHKGLWCQQEEGGGRRRRKRRRRRI